MKRMFRLLGAVTFAALYACGGGGGATSGPSTVPPRVQTPTPPPLASFAFHIVSLTSGRTTIGVAPAGTTPTLPAGFQLGSPVANAAIIYPDGSSQSADANGVFYPSASSYASTYSATLQTRGAAQPFVKVVDPQAGVLAGTGHVLAAAGASGALRLGGVTVLPNAAQLFPGEIVMLVVAGTDVDDRIADLGGAHVTWASSSGATIAPIPGTGQALYVAPPVASNSQVDSVVATVSIAGTAFPSRSSTQITTLSTSSGFSVAGTLANGSGAPIGGATAVFVADDPPRVTPSLNFAALADASGAYSRLLPPNTDFSFAIGVPSGSTPAGNAGVVTGLSSPGNQSSFVTGASGASAGLNLQIGGAADFLDAKDDAQNAFPDPIVSVRDAWLAHEVTRPYPFWADSGIASILSAAPTFGIPQPVANGIFAQWCYQWQSRGSTNVLVAIENSDNACSSPGNEAFEVSTVSGGGYSFNEYRILSGSYVLGGTLDAQTGAILVATGTWQPSLTQSGGVITNDVASVQLSFFGPISQSVASPVSQLSMQYTYGASNATAASVQFSNVLLTDQLAALTLATGSATLARGVGLSSCVGVSGVTCYSGSASFVRTYAVGSASVSRTFVAQDAIAGDGSALHVVTSSNAGDASAVRVPIANARSRAAGSCVVCAAQAGALLDSDGSTQIGAFTVSAQQGVAFNLLDTTEGAGPGTPLDSLLFAL